MEFKKQSSALLTNNGLIKHPRYVEVICCEMVTESDQDNDIGVHVTFFWVNKSSKVIAEEYDLHGTIKDFLNMSDSEVFSYEDVIVVSKKAS